MKYLKFKYLYIILGILLTCYLLSQGVKYYPDSIGYIEGQPIRSAGYSIIILVFKLLFGASGLYILYIFQLIIILLTILSLINFLKKRFKLTETVVLMLSLFFYYAFYRIGRGIATEPLALTFFLLSIRFLLEAIQDRKLKPLIKYFISLFLLVLIRAQFYFLYPVTIVVILYIYIVNRDLKMTGKAIVLFIITILSVNLMDRTYHFVKHDRFISTPYTGLQLVTDVLYISEKKDSIYIKDAFHRKLFDEIQDSLSVQNLTFKSFNSQNKNAENAQIINHYNYAYNEICHRNAKVIFGKYINNEGSMDYFKEIDEMTLEISKNIVLNKPKQFLKLYMDDILRNGFGSNIFFIFFMATFIFGLIKTYQEVTNEKYVFLVLASLIVINNYLLVALVEPILIRYSIYSSIIYFSAILILIEDKIPYEV